jgi:hypothetical protein
MYSRLRRRVAFPRHLVTLGIFLPLGLCLLSAGAARSADDTAEVRYKWKEGETYIYSTHIEVDTNDVTETLDGTSYYFVKSAKDGFVLVHRGHLHAKRESSDGRHLPPDHTNLNRYSPFKGVGVASIGNKTEIHIDAFGKAEKVRGSSQLPFMLGNLAMMVVSPLPSDGSDTLEDSREVNIKLYTPSRNRLRPPESVDYPATDKTTYKLGKRDGDKLEITKDYSLKTEARRSGKPYMEMTGDGTITFDVAQGVPLSMKSKTEIRESGGKASITVSYHLLEGEEKERLLKANADAKEARSKGGAGGGGSPGIPLADTDLDQALKDLKSTNADTRKAAAEQLARAAPDDAHRAKVASALTAVMTDPNIFVRGAAAKALRVWGSKEDVPSLLKLLDHSDVFVRSTAMEALGPLQDERAAKAIAPRLDNGFDRGAASKSLKAMGPVAEKFVIPLLASADAFTRTEACKVLKEIGGSASVDALQAASKDSNAMVARAAKEALNRAQSR